VIVRAIEPLPSEQLLRAAGRHRLPCALSMPDHPLGPRLVMACDPVRVVRGDSVEELAEAWTWARAAWGSCARSGLPVAIGFLGYDLGRRFERIRGRALPASPWPEIEFRFYDAMVVTESRSDRCEIWARDEPAAFRTLWEWIEPVRGLDHEVAVSPARALVEMEPPERHLAAVARALDYIRAGDVYQVNLARRLTCSLPDRAGEAPGLSLFERLAAVAPAPHAVWLADSESRTALVGNSPERFLRLDTDGQIETWPIKGTRPRAEGTAADPNADALLASAKDRAEHVMIVDLERNDLGRICQTGSVRVDGLCRLLSLPTVHHMVTTVRGQLRSEVGLAEILRATFPGGSVTGAPKIRAMEIIEELEPARRGPYTGATGWLGAAGDLDLAVAIRTALIREGQLTLWVGGGIVADSQPQAELAETWDKAKAFSRAL
jgi:para-aminobenzoate synthetase component 1